MTLPYFQYQNDGGYYLAAVDRGGLHDEMGVGKTATVWNAVDRAGMDRGIVICPAFLRQNWIGEYHKFVSTPRRLIKGMNIHDFHAWERGRFNILVTSYEQATKWAPMIRASGEPLDFVAIDEGHYLKNGGAARTKAIFGPELDGSNGLIEWSQHVWHITGTPMANDPVDIYTFLRMCHATTLSQDAFVKRFFIKKLTRFGARMEPRPEMVPEMQALIANNSIRRMKRDVGIHLPPIHLTSMLVDGDTDAIRQLIREYPGLERAIMSAVEQGGLSFLDAQHIATLRRLIGEAKAIPYGYVLHEELTSGATDKRVVYGIHVDALTNLRDFLWKNNIYAVLVNGTTSEKDRIEAVRAFQEDDRCKVFIGNIRAAGVGITLTAACEIDILESDWSPAGNAQAIMRVHRIGQTRTVHGRFVTLAHSLDEVVNRIVAQKTAAIAQIEGEAMHAAPLDVLGQISLTS